MKLISLISFFCVPFLLFSQVLITEGEFETRGADPSSVLELASTHGGLLIPRMDTRERDEIKNPVEGLLIYNLEESCLNVFSSDANDWLTYCNIRYSEDCSCIEYLHAYGSPREEWLPLNINSSDADWYVMNTSLPPTSIHDDIYTMGKTFIGTASPSDIIGQLNVSAESDSIAHGSVIQLQGNNAAPGLLASTLILRNDIQNNNNTKVGILSSIVGNSNTPIFGLFNVIDHAGNGEKVSIHNQFSNSASGKLTGMSNSFSSNGSNDQQGVYNAFAGQRTGDNYGLTSDFPSHAGTSYGMYNNFKNDSSGNDIEGTMIGSYNTFSSQKALKSYGHWNVFEATTNGTKTGYFNEFPSTTQNGTVYGLHNKISNDSPQNKFGVHNNISNSDGSAFGVRTDIVASSTNSKNQYGTYNRVFGGSGTNYGGYFSTNGAGNMGIYAKNTTTDGYAGAFNGDVEVGNGYLTVGDNAPGANNLDNSMVRHGVWEAEYGGNYPNSNSSISLPTWLFVGNFDGFRYLNLGPIDLPDHVSGTVIATKVIMKSSFIAWDANENTGLAISFADEDYIGFTGWMGDSEYVWGEDNIKDYQFTSRELNIPITDMQNIRCRLQDEDHPLSTDDPIWLHTISVKIYYEYTSTLQEGDIAASGLIYSNTNSQMGDLAEYFEVDKEEGIENGLIVSFKPGTDNEYEIADTPYSNFIVGVISENPSVVLNNPNVGPPVALSGRVKVKVLNDTMNLIQSGDYLTTSSIPGTAMIARRPGRVIGYAVTNQKPGEDYVEILVQPGHYAPPESQ